ncbi:unnamed protein product [Calypogeia fissa]
MSQALLCPYCSASEGRCVVVGGGRFLTECRSCGRVMEERVSEVDEIFIERAHDAPLCIVTPDFSENESYKAPPIEDDPFESIGFITAFSTWSLEQCPLFTATSTSFSGQLAELERLLSDSLYSNGGAVAASLAGASMSTVDTLRAYFQIVEVSSVLGLERDSCDHAIQLFRDCLSTTYLRNRNIEALATAALVQAIREQQEPRTLQEISTAANIPQKEIARHMKVLSDALKLSQPINSNSISVHMPRFCNLLQLSKTTQDLATHIGEVVINKSFCTRRNPISISAAAIYLSCQLEDKRKTQTEICKATGLTEVTLRKVYKELLENLTHLLPPGYTPAVPLEKAFPMTAAALGRVHVARAAVSMSEPSLPTTPYNSAVSNNSAGLGGDTSSVVGGSGGSSPAQPNMIRVPVSGGSATDRATVGVPPYRGSTPPNSDGRPGVPLFNVPHLGSIGHSGGEGGVDRTRMDGPKDMERDRNEQRERDKDREPDRMDTDYPPPKKPNMMPPASLQPGFRPSFFPFAQVDPRIFQEMNPGLWPVHLYGAPAMRPAEEGTTARGNDRSREDGGGNQAMPNSKPPPPQQQYVSFIPGMPEGLNPNMQVKMLQLMQGRPPDAVERQQGGGTFERDNREPERDRDHEGEIGENGSHTLPPSSTNQAATLQAFASGRQGAPVFTGFPPGLWPILSAGGPGPYGMFPPQLVQTQGGGLPQGLRQGGESHPSGFSEKSLEGLPQGLLASAGTEALARMAGGPGGVPGQPGGLGGQPGHLPMPWPGAPFHPLFLPATMNVGPGPGPAAGMSNGIINEAPNGMKREGGGGGDGNARHAAPGAGMNLSQRPVADMFPMLSMTTGSHGAQGPSGHDPGHSLNTSQRADNGGTTTTSVAMSNQQPSFDRQAPHERQH